MTKSHVPKVTQGIENCRRFRGLTIENGLSWRSSWQSSGVIKASQTEAAWKRSNGTLGDLLQATAYAEVATPTRKMPVRCLCEWEM